MAKKDKIILEVEIEETKAEKDLKKIEKAQQAYMDTLSETGKTLREVKRAHKDSATTLKLQEQLARSTAGSYNALSAQYRLNMQRLNQMSQAERENTKEGRMLVAKTKEIRTSMNNMQKAVGNTSLEVGNYKENIKAAWNELKKGKKPLKNIGEISKNSIGSLKDSSKALLGKVGLVAAFAGLFKIWKSGIILNMKFNKEMSTLAGILGTTRDDVSKLAEDAKRLGKETEYTSVQVSKLQQAYARLGFDQQQILDMTESTLSGATGMMSELGDTAELVGSVMNSFNKSSTETSKVVDILTSSTTKTALNFEKLRTALPIVGGAAYAVGDSLEDLVARLGVAANAGIDASTSATSLRNIYIELKKAGLTMDEALSRINNSTDKVSTATELFGKRAAITGLALAENVDKANDLAKAFNNSAGAADRLRKTQLDNLDGDLKKLSSAWDNFVMNISKGSGVIRTTVQGITWVIDRLGVSFSELGKRRAKEVVDGLKTSTKSLEEFQTAYEKTITKSREKYNEFLESGNKQAMEKEKGFRSAFIELANKQWQEIRAKQLEQIYDIKASSSDELQDMLTELTTKYENANGKFFDLEQTALQAVKDRINKELQLREEFENKKIEEAKEAARLKNEKEYQEELKQLDKDLKSFKKTNERELYDFRRELRNQEEQDGLDDLEKDIEKQLSIQDKFKNMNDSFNEEKYEKLKEWKEKEYITEQEYQDKVSKLNKSKANMEAKEAEALSNAKISAASKTAKNASIILGKESKAGKIASIAQTSIDTYQSAQAAYKSMAGIPIVGPALGAIAAAAAVKMGMENIGKIKQQKFATGGIVSGSSYSGDNVNVRVNAGEMILNQQQQSRLFDQINNNVGVDYDRLGDVLASKLQDQRVYVLESDITTTQHRVTVRESEFVQ